MYSEVIWCEISVSTSNLNPHYMFFSILPFLKFMFFSSVSHSQTHSACCIWDEDLHPYRTNATLTPMNGVVWQKLIRPQLFEKLRAFFGTRMCIGVFTVFRFSACHLFSPLFSIPEDKQKPAKTQKLFCGTYVVNKSAYNTTKRKEHIFFIS
jgi:hypothetical protein